MQDFEFLVWSITDWAPSVVLAAAGGVLAWKLPNAPSFLVLIGFVINLSSRLAWELLPVEPEVGGGVVDGFDQVVELAYYGGRLGALVAAIGLIWHAAQLKSLRT